MNTLSTITSRPDAAAQTVRRSLLRFFVLTLGWMGLCGDLTTLVAHDVLAWRPAPPTLISLGALMPIVAWQSYPARSRVSIQ